MTVNIKMGYLIGIVITAIILIGLLSMGNRGIKYPYGRDTVKSFGDGTYQILRDSQTNLNILMSLEPPQEVIMKNVNKFREVRNRVFLIGDKYVILDYKVKEFIRKDNYNDFAKEDKGIFQKME